MNQPELIFKPSESSQLIFLESDIVEIFLRNRQIGKNSFETGGQLFADIQKSRIIIKAVTLPGNTEKRSKYSFYPDRKKQIKEINHYYKLGLHYVGDWHTHPVSNPEPSFIDITSMRDCFNKSKHELNYFLLVIIGTSTDMNDNWLGLINQNNIITLLAAPSMRHLI